jgi:hypothetical protein
MLLLRRAATRHSNSRLLHIIAAIITNDVTTAMKKDLHRGNV